MKEKVRGRDHMVTTLDRWRGDCLCHVNMLKLYCERDELQAPGTDRSPESLSSAEMVSARVSLVMGPAWKLIVSWLFPEMSI